MPRLFAVPLAAALLVVALSAGCSSSSSGSSSGPSTSSPSSSVTAWADGVCSALGSWKTSITSAVTSIAGGNLSKNSLQAAGDSASSATSKLQADLKNLKAPTTTAGQQAKSSVDQLANALATGTDSIKAAVQGVSGVTGIPAAVAAITTAVATMQSQISTAYDNLRSANGGEIDSAFQQASSCQQLAPSSHSS